MNIWGILTNWNLLLNYGMNYEYKTEIFFLCVCITIVIICVLSSFSIFAICAYLCYSFYCEFSHALWKCEFKLSNIQWKVFFSECFIMHTHTHTYIVVDFNEALHFFVSSFFFFFYCRLYKISFNSKIRTKTNCDETRKKNELFENVWNANWRFYGWHFKWTAIKWH